MALAIWLTVGDLPAKSACHFKGTSIVCPRALGHYGESKSSLRFKSSLKCHCIKNEIPDKPTEDFSVLSSDNPWDRGSIWSIMAMYMFNLHIPLGIGGLSVVAYALHQPVLDPQTEVLSLFLIQNFELIGAMFLLRSTAKPEHKLTSFFAANRLSNERNWLLASVLGFGCLIVVVFLTSLIADRFVGAKAVNNPILKEILLSSNLSKVACVLIYCLITPLLEETIYRGFLLTSLASTKNWQHAVFVSSAVFSAAHFSVHIIESLPLFPCLLVDLLSSSRLYCQRMQYF